MPGRWAHDMPIGLAVLFKIPLISAGCYHGLIFHREYHHGILTLRVLNTDLPRGTVRLCAHRLHIAAKIQQSGLHAVFPQHLCRQLTGIALGNTPEVDLHSLRQGDGAGGCIILNLPIIHKRKQGLNLRLVRHLIASGGKAPGSDDRING